MGGRKRDIWQTSDPDFLDKVAKLARTGKTDKEIGKELGVHERAVLRARHRRGIRKGIVRG
ncbi:MAG: hypothetical protein ACREN0_11180 [Thermodesulfobacteriota bacterium]